ncbi:MAG: hypothetical protein QF510_08450, partial [Rhodospirillales bacterium]|nr:hypothetical protein [Rhodospirillales bacterium]
MVRRVLKLPQLAVDLVVSAKGHACVDVLGFLNALPDGFGLVTEPQVLESVLMQVAQYVILIAKEWAATIDLPVGGDLGD